MVDDGSNVIPFESRKQKRERLLRELQYRLEIEELRKCFERVEALIDELNPMHPANQLRVPVTTKPTKTRG
jgi:hypothetical protein